MTHCRRESLRDGVGVRAKCPSRTAGIAFCVASGVAPGVAILGGQDGLEPGPAELRRDAHDQAHAPAAPDTR